jgi:succinate dehydrogenase / fumarate reductase iron-sulfur subunit
MNQSEITFRIFRYRPGDPESGRFDTAVMEVEETTTVLNVLECAYREDRTLMYRHSCHHGSCGTCACRINGRERLACTTRVLDLDTDVVTIEPLVKLRRVGDLVTDPADFFREYPPRWQTLRSSEANPGARTPPEIPEYVRLENCIECGACVSACPVEDFLGPAVLAGLNRERLNRGHCAPRSAGAADSGYDDRTLLALAGGQRGVWRCQRALECSRVCPAGVYPARHIQELRNMLEEQ